MEILRVILGSTGLVGSAWKRYQPNSIFVERPSIENWFSNQPEVSIAEFFETLPKDREIEIHICFGNTNSMEKPGLLMQINCSRPLFIARLALIRNFRVITYGSALEIFGIRNNYFDSKRALAVEFTGLETRNLWTNVNLHTLYSESRPHEHMFLGQIYSAIKDGTHFNMTSGKQLREFHHVDDDIQIVDKALRLNSTQHFEVSHGRPLELIQVADYLFDSFGSSSLLRRNTYPDNPNDNYTKIFKVNPVQDTIIHRDPLITLQRIFSNLLEQERMS